MEKPNSLTKLLLFFDNSVPKKLKMHKVLQLMNTLHRQDHRETWQHMIGN